MIFDVEKIIALDVNVDTEENYGVVDEPFDVPFIYDESANLNSDGIMFPISYNAGENKNYVTSIKNQGNLSIC